MCIAPETVGGGVSIEYVLCFGFGLNWKVLFLFQNSKMFFSISFMFVSDIKNDGGKGLKRLGFV